MKKLKLFVTTMLAMFVATVGVNALTTTTGGLSSGLTIENITKTEDGYSTVKVTVKVDQGTITHILGQTPGYQGSENGKASLGIFYISIDPDIARGDGNLDKHYAYTSADCDFACAMDKAKANADAQSQGNDHDSTTTIWTLGVQILYNKDGVWTKIDEEGTGIKTIEDAIKDATNNHGTLIYGKDYIFAVPESDTVWVWRTTEGGQVKYTYVRVTYDIEFPITASNGERSYYYTSIEQALDEAEKNGVTEINVNEPTTVKEEVIIPAGVTIKTVNSATLTFEKKVTVEAGANIVGENVTYTKGVTKYYAITTEAENGKVTVDKTSAQKDEEVKITIKADEGYELDKLYVDGKEQKELTFKMPEKDVVVKATFKKIVVQETVTEEENPKTGDNILMYLSLGFASVAVAALSVKKLRKTN